MANWEIVDMKHVMVSSRNSAVQDVPYEELAARLPIVGDTGRALAVSAARD